MNHYEDSYPSPWLFTPEKHLNASNPRARSDLVGEKYPGRWDYSKSGFENMPGAGFAVNSLRIAGSKILWRLDVELSFEDRRLWTDRTMIKPKPLGVVFEVRSEGVREEAEKHVKDPEEYFSSYNCYCVIAVASVSAQVKK